jgi:hypothetical protein
VRETVFGAKKDEDVRGSDVGLGEREAMGVMQLLKKARMDLLR